MSSIITTENSPIPIAKMVNDLFMQWLSLPDTRSTLTAALRSVRTNSKMPDPIVYAKTYSTRGGGLSKSQHFESPPVSPVPRPPSSPRINLSNSMPFGDSTSGTSYHYEEKKPRLSKKPSIEPKDQNSSIDLQNRPLEPSAVKFETVTSTPSTSTSIVSNRSTFKTTIRSSLEIPVKPSPQSPRSVALEQTSEKVVTADSSLQEPVKSTAKESVPPSLSIDQVKRPTSPQTKKTFPITTKVEEKPKPPEVIPEFYVSDAKQAAEPTRDAVINKQLSRAKDELFTLKNDKLHFEDFGKLAQLIDLTLYWKEPLFRACVLDALGPKATITSNTTITYAQFEAFWKKICKNNHDKALKFVYLLTHSSPTTLPTNRQYLTADDWDYMVQDIIDTHPGLKFLREAREFHSRYIKTVVARVFYDCNRSWSTKLTVPEIRRSNFLQTLDRLQDEEDINRIHDYFSYEHFYVIYCKFWDIDSDHDLFISRDDLAKHNGGAISNKMIDRIFSGAVSNSPNMKEGKMSYYEFVWFLISEEDKCSPTSIEYWFRCMDIDGDGILSMYELEYFYQEQIHKMEIYGIEYMSFEDCICQMLDLVKPDEDNKIRLKDLKRCKLANIFFDTFFNLEKYLANEQKDPFSNLKDPDAPQLSDWVRYAETEYDNLTHEDGGNDDDENYDDDFENDDDGVEDAKNKKPAGNSGSTSNDKSDDMQDELKRWKD